MVGELWARFNKYFRNQARNMDFIHRAGITKTVICPVLLESKVNLVVHGLFILIFVHFLS